MRFAILACCTLLVGGCPDGNFGSPPYHVVDLPNGQRTVLVEPHELYALATTATITVQTDKNVYRAELEGMQLRASTWIGPEFPPTPASLVVTLYGAGTVLCETEPVWLE